MDDFFNHYIKCISISTFQANVKFNINQYGMYFTFLKHLSIFYNKYVFLKVILIQSKAYAAVTCISLTAT